MIHRDDYWRRAEEGAAFLAELGLGPADVVLQCGSGLHQLAELLLPESRRVPLHDIPHMPGTSVVGHGREAVFGTLGSARLLVLTGRLHLYEGYSPEIAAFPAALAKACGASLYIATNAAGALNQHMRTGELMLHTDFINFQGDNAIAHIQADEPMARFIDPKPAYNLTASGILARHLHGAGAGVHEGVYVSVRGPLYETRAELYMLRSFGADAIGMSTVPEITVCNFFALPAIGLSVITNECFNPAPVTHGDVLAASQAAIPKLAAGLRSFIENPGEA
jgi:purine-nucleoside phosphorylase